MRYGHWGGSKAKRIKREVGQGFGLAESDRVTSGHDEKRRNVGGTDSPEDLSPSVYEKPETEGYRSSKCACRLGCED